MLPLEISHCLGTREQAAQSTITQDDVVVRKLDFNLEGPGSHPSLVMKLPGNFGLVAISQPHLPFVRTKIGKELYTSS